MHDTSIAKKRQKLSLNSILYRSFYLGWFFFNTHLFVWLFPLIQLLQMNHSILFEVWTEMII